MKDICLSISISTAFGSSTPGSTAYNVPTICQPERGHSPALILSASVLLTGAVATVIMILAMLTGFFVHRTSHLSHRLLSLVTLALTCLTTGPAFYIAIVENQPGVDRSLALILDIAQFIVSVVATLLSGIMPFGRMFGDRVASRASCTSTVPCFSNFHGQLKRINQSQIFNTFYCKQAPGSMKSSHILREGEVHCKIQGTWPKISTLRLPLDPVMPRLDKNGLMAGSAERCENITEQVSWGSMAKQCPLAVCESGSKQISKSWVHLGPTG
ncbi:hypothetical protein V8E52_003906 [Russula decolorans]|jgi:hypothetical protein